MAGARKKKRTEGAGSVWERPERAQRPVLSPLSRERIVDAAIALADEHGLEAVSLRKVGAELDAGPMRLYGYVATKDELLELMVDNVFAELNAALPDGWREALAAVATRLRTTTRNHSWFVGLLGGRPQFGPNALAHREAVFAVLSASPGFEDIDVVLQTYRTVLSYAIGAIQSEQNELRAEHQSGLETDAWQNAMWPYMQRAIASGRYPSLAKIVGQAKHPSRDVVFERGLATVLDGIAVRLQQ